MKPTAARVRPGPQRILHLRNQRVMLDVDLARLFETSTGALNQAVTRNLHRFPGDFMFRLTGAEKQEVITSCDNLQNLKYSPAAPRAFTEHGIVMLASVLNTRRAVEASVEVVREFIGLRQAMTPCAPLARKLDSLERKYDRQFRAVFEAIRALMHLPDTPRGRIGFRTGDNSDSSGMSGRRRGWKDSRGRTSESHCPCPPASRGSASSSPSQENSYTSPASSVPAVTACVHDSGRCAGVTR